MKKLITILIVISLKITNISAQKFSFFDNVEIGISPVYALNNWNIKYKTYNPAFIDVWNPLNSLEKEYVEIDPIQLKNYLSMEYDIKYFLKVYNSFKIGLGLNYKTRKMEYDVFLGRTKPEELFYFTILPLKYKAEYDYLGMNLNFRWQIEKIKTSFSFYWELNRPFNKDDRRPELYVLYGNDTQLSIRAGHSYPNSFIDCSYIGLHVNKQIWNQFYLNFHLAYKYGYDYFSVFNYINTSDINSPQIIFDGLIRSKDIIVGLGLVYQFSGRK